MAVTGNWKRGRDTRSGDYKSVAVGRNGASRRGVPLPLFKCIRSESLP